MHHQIWIPDAAPSANEQAALLARVGLADHATDFDAMLSPGPVANQPGTLFAWTSPTTPRLFEYDPAAQDWRPAAPREGLDAGRYWVGVDRRKPPTPLDLRRRYQQPGIEVELGQWSWLVPEARQLEAAFVLADDGSYRFEPQRQFVAFGQRAERIAQEVARQIGEAGVDGVQFPTRELIDFAIEALAINYRITIEVAAALQMLTNQNAQRPLFAVIGAYAARRQAGR